MIFRCRGLSRSPSSYRPTIRNRDNALLFPAVLIAIAFALAAGMLNGILVSIFRLNAIIATIGMNALLYGGVFAVSGGVPRSQRPPCWQQSPAAKHSGLPNAVYFALAALLVVSFMLKKTVVGRASKPSAPILWPRVPRVFACSFISSWPMSMPSCSIAWQAF